MKLHTIHSGNFKLDGGAMFGVVPKSLWSRTNPADDNNMCPWSMRLLLIEDGDRLMLVDTGIGDKQSAKFFSFYFLFGDHSLDGSLKAAGFSREDITDVFLTHLHFDHVGGAIQRASSGADHFEPAFKNATFWSNERHWKWATEPNAREKASFLSENILPLQESGQLQFIQRGEGDRVTNVFPGMDVLFVDGHTDSQMIPMIDYKGTKLVFMADLLPSTGHIPLPYVMGYDTRPLLTLSERQSFFPEIAEKEYVLFLEHDYYNDCCTLQQTEKGPRLKETFSLSDL
jgi:glyoxylase-like metal-dependent hydrolase (beta-lactamase superfamily II)